MSGNIAGALKTAAGRVGLTVEDYTAKVDGGLKWCTACKSWHERSAFTIDARRGDGLAAACQDAKNGRSRRLYVHRGKPERYGRAPDPPRDGDKRQARKRVNQLVLCGRLPRPNDVPCADCGHVTTPADRTRHEYDHHRGYAAEHHLSVEAVCAPCHRRRAIQRGEWRRKRVS